MMYTLLCILARVNIIYVLTKKKQSIIRTLHIAWVFSVAVRSEPTKNERNIYVEVYQ